MNVWQVGNVKVTRVVEVEAIGGTRFILPDATPENVKSMEWMKPHFMTEEGKLIMSIHALVVDTGDHRIIVDTCVGNDKDRKVPSWDNLQTSFLKDLETAGYLPEMIDTVLCTHLHVDHVGWNTMLKDGKWIPTFPNANYLFGKTEWEHWQNEDQDHYGPVIEDSVQPIVDGGLARFIDVDYKICDEVSLVSTPGHTPGHVSVKISSEGEEAFITGDSIHHPCQMSRLDWACAADHDPEEAKKTREEMLADLADREPLVIGTHFATPTAGKVRSDGKGAFWFEV
ncbi:MAG: MBL fold metallo-hydrolase [Sneathiellales bacterium]|nr:MBL fold metallo-hydrolase [Sneathiellales bacterium]